MFYQLELTRELDIPPKYLGSRLAVEIERRLRQEVEGNCDGQHGFVLAVIYMHPVGKGMIREGVGTSTFNVRYTCMTFMPHKGEVLDAVVKSVNKMGFFAEAGPLTVFVSNHLIPEDFEFETTHEPCYVTADGEQKVLPGSEVRLRIVGTRVDANEIFAVGTIKDDFLGVIGGTV